MSELTKVFVLGDKQEGLVLVRMEPLLVVQVTPDELNRYAANEGISYDEAFDKAISAAQGFVDQSDEGQGAGRPLSVAYVKEADLSNVHMVRWFYAPLLPALEKLGGPETGVENVPLVNSQPGGENEPH